MDSVKHIIAVFIPDSVSIFILRIKGGSNATAHVGTIDLEQLREFQMKAYSGQKEDKTFKPTPPDFDYKGAYERRKGTMFECFCAKKKAD